MKQRMISTRINQKGKIERLNTQTSNRRLQTEPDEHFTKQQPSWQQQTYIKQVDRIPSRSKYLNVVSKNTAKNVSSNLGHRPYKLANPNKNMTSAINRIMRTEPDEGIKKFTSNSSSMNQYRDMEKA